MYETTQLLTELLEQQNQQREQSLFKKGIFTLRWRTKVGSCPHPDTETLTSAGEPSGAWKWSQQDFDTLENRKSTLPINGYIPASSIRGMVKAWAKQRPGLKSRVNELLGYSNHSGQIFTGKVAFLDAWPTEATQLKRDIVNPQEKFQVYHDPEQQGKPLPFYTLGNGNRPITVIVAIQGIRGSNVTEQEIEEAWSWVQQALTAHGIGGRTASGYGAVESPEGSTEMSSVYPGYAVQDLNFTLYSQGSAGPETKVMELRPSHWRGWLRSWMLRCFLGLMNESNAQKIVGKLMGSLEANDGQSQAGVVRLRQSLRDNQPIRTTTRPEFYIWQGQLSLAAPEDILQEIVLPVVRFAISVGGVGRGWRRPLHIFQMKKGDRFFPAVRGTHLLMTRRDRAKNKTFQYQLPSDPQHWSQLYDRWSAAVQKRWSSYCDPDIEAHLKKHPLRAEIFSPKTCTVYVVPGTTENPLDTRNKNWTLYEGQPLPSTDTHGDGLYLVYRDTKERRYKRNPELGGNAAQGGNQRSHCSWVSIRRIDKPNQIVDTDCQEVVCLFMGEWNKNTNSYHPVRMKFLQDLDSLTGESGATQLFGINPST
ncbi:RAMP superfamily protein [Nodosilinea sp. LEGE 07088]|uniref:RAMP superfamily CRISPR-associated protein n=1 Tax=Nodosilinea sp. LEGE 07088 TaxID=2777968 RepID=UPI00187FE86D|nr:RAMP superfamily CRISPR-associated protein [Nodosilinea sp. LEGE 07088]MBE9138183.1 RAMP superfamily protein [Nodosilinea sp. LEGE 07088]